MLVGESLGCERGHCSCRCLQLCSPLQIRFPAAIKARLRRGGRRPWLCVPLPLLARCYFWNLLDLPRTLAPFPACSFSSKQTTSECDSSHQGEENGKSLLVPLFVGWPWSVYLQCPPSSQLSVLCSPPVAVISHPQCFGVGCCFSGRQELGAGWFSACSTLVVTASSGACSEAP